MKIYMTMGGSWGDANDIVIVDLTDKQIQELDIMSDSEAVDFVVEQGQKNGFYIVNDTPHIPITNKE